MSDSPDSPRRADVRRRFDRAAVSFDDADFVHRTTGDGLLERLQPVTVDAARVLELGSATGSLARQLAKRFRGSRVVCLDLSLPMLAASRRRRSRFSRLTEVHANAEALPFLPGSVDVIVANQLLPWIGDVPALFDEVARVLRKDGVFAFASLGPDSLHELREAFSGDGDAHVQRFADMHDVGDALVRAGLRDPVLDIDRLRVAYPDTRSLYRDLGACGARNTLDGRRATLTGRERFARADRALAAQAEDGRLNVTLELTYGHAWGGGPRTPPGEFRVPLTELAGRRR